MLHSPEFMRAVHADRVRDLERSLRDRRMLETVLEAEKTESAAASGGQAGRPIAVTGSAHRGGSACEPA
jgi:hypothetical protein